MLRNQQRTVTITQEPEIMAQGIIIYSFPVAMNKSTDKQK